MGHELMHGFENHGITYDMNANRDENVSWAPGLLAKVEVTGRECLLAHTRAQPGK